MYVIYIIYKGECHKTKYAGFVSCNNHLVRDINKARKFASKEEALKTAKENEDQCKREEYIMEIQSLNK
jgi:hypothetical protein